jgi:hypothetical protein
LSARRYERLEIRKTVHWDYFTASSGAKKGYLANVSKGGCLLKTSELIEHRRWLRLMIEDGNVLVSIVGRVTRCENVIEAFGKEDLTLYRYGIEFTHPSALSNDEPEQVFAEIDLNRTARPVSIKAGSKATLRRV